MEARSRILLAVDQAVLVVTCPALADSLLRHWVGETEMEKIYNSGDYGRTLDRLEANAKHGVVAGKVTRCDPQPRPSGTFDLDVDLGEEVLLETDDLLVGATQELTKLEQEIPWARPRLRMGDRDMGSLLLGMLAFGAQKEEDAFPRKWPAYVHVPDGVYNALVISDSPEAVAAMDPEGFEQILKEAIARGDSELQAVIEDPEALMALFKSRQRQPRPFGLVLPDTEAHREMLDYALFALVERVRLQTTIEVHDRRGRI